MSESAEKGPSIYIFFFFNFLILGIINFISSLPIVLFSPACGFIPAMAILGFFILKSFIKLMYKLYILL